MWSQSVEALDSHGNRWGARVTVLWCYSHRNKNVITLSEVEESLSSHKVLPASRGMVSRPDPRAGHTVAQVAALKARTPLRRVARGVAAEVAVIGGIGYRRIT